jgi:ribonuclease HII
MKKFLIGIDEAGRGPLAGPVSVGVVVVPATFNQSLFEGIRDSKKLTELARERWYEKLPQLAQEGLRYKVGFSSATYIDTYGIVPAIKRAIAEALRELEVDPEEASVLLDGSLKAPKEFLLQQTIIRGDETEPVISIASVAAKVERDRLMCALAIKYPNYGFEVHKGYGTKAHYEAILRHGMCDIHRKSFCKVPVEKPLEN